MLASNIIFFPCKDLHATLDFYATVTGITVYREMENCIILDSGYGYLGFCKYDDGRPMADGVCISFNAPEIEDVDRYYQEIRKKKQECVLCPPKYHDKFPAYSFFMKDPNGYTVEIQKIL